MLFPFVDERLDHLAADLSRRAVDVAPGECAEGPPDDAADVAEVRGERGEALSHLRETTLYLAGLLVVLGEAAPGGNRLEYQLDC